ncbi:LysR family transcriptional regulator [Bradyrhizobium sp. U87765 SZCCT0131]|uniref:LysR family transcriptional regulator n=1 Tax=unclassified Bradyrhizobium TaxID=2631580 RepID=UPI001BA7C6DB|nr:MULTISPECIES: LysR family transcriptional regulator [unclassified Bradyrhizobium]MBR1219250.1 LysR family transcriptional regulator [Bradyrhizobium sp. U87765 SZCCT0131]MBR1261901.1 LysR family transcriptional regulator [Bradyrhizobium sp. U87765 SZCCT0134]MBR1306246.1 LysR family transcriptional regulator [Bradyrhizobium sp. U87765 SZCCT0110]MBR1317683.1 LysR family transcriptional regulator [Bradyrhizobium sp. U87765 SZCCT0109]MBR1351385.1 LysR family transcriptional regulator [Bradyrhizo
MDRLRAFEVFAAVVAQGSFTRAADKLETSPANVTRYVNDLEELLGARLLNRTSRRLSLTDTGRTLHERVSAILEEVAEAEAVASSASVQPRGRLRINAPLTFGIAHLAPLWPRFMARYPEIELDVSLTDRVVDLVEEGYDLAVRIARGGSTSLIGRKLAASRNIVCAAPDYLARHGAPQTPRDLRQHACIGYTYSATADEWVLLDAAGKPHSVTVRSCMHTNNADTARAAALAGRGIIWQPTFLIGADLRRGGLVRVLPDYRLADIDIMAVYPSRRHVSAKVRVMVEFLAEAFRGTPGWDLDASRVKARTGSTPRGRQSAPAASRRSRA